MEVIVAKSAGFCFGVNNAVNLIYKLLEEESDKIYTFGPIIHNEYVVNELKEKGVEVIEKIEDAKENSTIVIRAHGVTPDIYKQISDRNLKTSDATCRYVKKIHKLVEQKFNEGYKIIIVGDKEHPEVKGIAGWCNNTANIVNSKENIDTLEESDENICVVSQTTITYEKWETLKKVLKEKFKNSSYFDTICNATSERQNEAEKIAKDVDAMFVVGGKNSSNTQKLYEICKKHCNKTYKIETVNDISLDEFNNIHKIGVTAGASTPAYIIENVVKEISKINDNSNSHDELSFKDIFESSIIKISEGDVLKGKVISLNNDDVFIDIGYKSDGIITKEEYSDHPDFDIKKNVAIGDELEVFVLKLNDGEGNVLLSKKRIDAIRYWDNIIDSFENKTAIEAKIIDVVKSGVVASFNGIRIFIPASQLSNKFVENLNDFLKTTVTFRIIELDEKNNKIVGSAKVILEEQKAKLEKEFWNNIEVGMKFLGTVNSLADYGAFVDLGGVNGLIHISELSWGKIKHPSEVLKVGDKVHVTVLDVNRDKKKISLTYRKTEDDPWKKIINEFVAGDIIRGKINRIATFGAFVEIKYGIEGLVHISQISNMRITKIDEILSVGQTVEAKIIEVDEKNKKIGLSIKEVSPIDPKILGVDNDIPNEHKEDISVTIGDLIKLKDTRRNR